MASWKWPAVLNKMLHDIPGINVLLNALLKQDVTGTTDVPAGAKQWVDTPEGKQFQVFNGQSWSSVGKLDHDAASVDGYDASPTVLKNTIPVRDANGDLPGNILGNAKTATKAGALSAVNPVEMGGTGGNTPEQARGNLGVPPTDHSFTGTDYGLGNVTEYGHNRLSDATDSDLGADGGTAATPLAVKTAKAEAITAAGEALEAFAEGQATKDEEQDEAIAEAQSSANAAQSSADALETNKADVDASNFSAAGKSVLAGMGMPSRRYVRLTVGVSGTQYIAPADGWFSLFATVSPDGVGTAQLYSPDTKAVCMIGMNSIGLAQQRPKMILPCRQGNSVQVSYFDSCTVNELYFIYAEGAE